MPRLLYASLYSLFNSIALLKSLIALSGSQRHRRQIPLLFNEIESDESIPIIAE